MPSTPNAARQRFLDATYEQQIRSITRDMEPRIRAAFLSGMQDIKDRAQMGRLRDALRSNDIEAAINALNIDAAALTDLQARIVETYGKSGAETISNGVWRYPDGTRAVVRWNSLSPRAEEYARKIGSALITNINNDTIHAARDTIADGYAFGRRADRIALDLVGRIGSNGKRQGGVIGLDTQSARWVNNLRRKLETDPKSALNMKLTARDKAFIRRTETLTQSQIDNILRRYENNLLLVRGRRIALTETANAVEAGKYEAWRQGLEKTGVPERFITKTWIHTGRAMDDRLDHVAFSGREVQGLDAVFSLPSGAQMRFPHDASLGAVGADIINCRCRCDYTLDRAGLRRWRESQDL